MVPYERLIGVIDLNSGQAVRAIGGRRHLYQPVKSFRRPGRTPHSIHGDPFLLAECYHSVGINSLYLADLDSLTGGEVQLELIQQLVSQVSAETVYVDLGLNDRMLQDSTPWLIDLMGSTRVRPILATEAYLRAESHDCASLIRACLKHCNIDSLVVSLDFRSGRFLSNSHCVAEWFSACVTEGVRTVIGLDLAAVGTGDPALTVKLCQQIRQSLPDVRLISGGGVRTARDAQRLLDSGANELLTASLFVR